MNCFEARRRLAAAPRLPDDATRAHVRECARCAALAARLAAQDERIETAARIDVPDGLADRVLLRVRGGGDALVAPPRIMTRRVAVFALAAAPVAVGSWLLLRRSDDALARAVLEHVVQDEPAELAAHPQGNPDALPGALASCGVQLPPQFDARYVGRCGPPERSSDHLVMNTPMGRVSVILMPAHAMARRATARARGAVTVLTPARIGSFAVVAADEETALRVIERLV